MVHATQEEMAEEMANGTYLDYKLRTTGGRYEVFTTNSVKEFSKKQVCVVGDSFTKPFKESKVQNWSFSWQLKDFNHF